MKATTMRRYLPLTAALLCAIMPARAQQLQGDWTGSIGVLGVIVHFDKTADGGWEGTLTVPQQRLKRKLEQLVVTPQQLSFALPEFQASYAARWDAAQLAWAGTWTQGQATPLLLKKADAAAVAALTPRRPQEAAIAALPPAATSTDVGFRNDAAGVDLAGTFSVPRGQGAGPFPAVVLVHGSGPHSRDEEVLGHKVFLVLADHLNRRGIAVLRYDKRGIGKSTGAYQGATTLDFADDAEAAVRFLRSRPEVDRQRLGILGHSEGGLIAPLVASRDPALAFVVMLAGPGVRGADLMVEQLALAARDAGVAEPQIARQRAFNRPLFAAIADAAQPDAARAKAAALYEAAERQGTLPSDMTRERLARFTDPWFFTFLRHDPAPALRLLRQPVLAINGELDQQVPAALDLAAIRQALAGNRRAVVKELPGLNHLMQTASSGGVSEYARIEETMSPLALETVSGWIAETVK